MVTTESLFAKTAAADGSLPSTVPNAADRSPLTLWTIIQTLMARTITSTIRSLATVLASRQVLFVWVSMSENVLELLVVICSRGGTQSPESLWKKSLHAECSDFSLQLQNNN